LVQILPNNTLALFQVFFSSSVEAVSIKEKDENICQYIEEYFDRLIMWVAVVYKLLLIKKLFVSDITNSDSSCWAMV
jgi:hypothetical protein